MNVLLALLVAGATLFGGDAQAQSGRSSAELRGQWYRHGPALVCKVAASKPLPQPVDPGILTRACQRMGPRAVGEDARNLRRSMGPPHRILQQPDGARALLYFVDKPEQFPYFVVTVAQDRIVALQVSGPVAAPTFGFNGVNLGDSTDAVVKHFGKPMQVGPSGQQDTDLWSYSPWAISFEVKAGRVVSIRVAEEKKS